MDNLLIKGINTWLRSICTVALYTYLPVLGGPGRKIEVGVISLGTTSQDGNQRQVKVEVLGILETEVKHIRLRAVEPVVDGDRNYRKRFSKILEPLLQWVHPESIIVTDLTVDKTTLHCMGFKHVHQSTSREPNCSNYTIMEYLRRIVPRMFQNTLSLLSRQIIQQFLDELVWREWYGTTASSAFDNIIAHLAEQTRVETGQSLINRLQKVAANPFKNWSLKSYMNTPAKPVILEPSATTKRQPNNKNRKSLAKAVSPTPEMRPPKSTSPDLPQQLVPLENYYYGTIPGSPVKTKQEVVLNFKCPICKIHLTNNIKLMDHLFTHNLNTQKLSHQCRYCLRCFVNKEVLQSHITSIHPLETHLDSLYVCMLCDFRTNIRYNLGTHMTQTHVPSELPYLCGTCGYRSSSHRKTVDHFYLTHDGGSTIQCPYCLKSTTVVSNGRMIAQNLSYFLGHIQKHQKKCFAKKCTKCSLLFVQKDYFKEHTTRMHVSVKKKAGLIPWPVPRRNIMVPKSKQDYQSEEEIVDLTKLIVSTDKTLKCKECSESLNTKEHFP